MAILASKGSLVAAANRAKGMVAEAEAEMKAVESLADKRNFDLQWKRLEVRGEGKRSVFDWFVAWLIWWIR